MRGAAAGLLACSAVACAAQADEVHRVAGMDEASSTEYVKLFLDGKLLQPEKTAGPPQLIAQCTRNQQGKVDFELLTQFGDFTDTAFHPTAERQPPDVLMPYMRKRVTIVMTFLGYRPWKPMKTQWQMLHAEGGTMRYNPPGMKSGNLEGPSYILRLLLALPTLRMDLDGKTVEYATAPLITAIRKEPLCSAAGI